ncbi:MAG: hypothetical protein ACLUGU_12230 [Alistipes shahii]
MYTIEEKVPNYAPQLPDIAKAKKSITGKARQLLTAALGREFMERSTRHKVYGLYFCLSLIASLRLGRIADLAEPAEPAEFRQRRTAGK